jgi:hypothetical protein
MQILDPTWAATFALAAAIAHQFASPLYVEFEHRRRLGSSPRWAEGVEKSPRCREPSRNPTHRQGPSGKDPFALRSILN